MVNLLQYSIQLLLEHQAESGAFPACPNFPTYQFAWFRDGSFCAHALALAGEQDAARRFHGWASRTLLRHADKIDNCIRAVEGGILPLAHQCFHSRFTLDGFEVPGNWGHNQLDGLGTWLWALNEFRRSHPHIPIDPDWERAAGLARDYLTALWRFPCSDCWEENEEFVHTSTLAAVYGGLMGVAEMFREEAARRAAEDIRGFIRESLVQDHHLVKSQGNPAVDASLVALYTPYRVVEWEDPALQATLALIRSELATPVGLHRYAGDTYYGGGEWVLLSAWLGWAYAQAGLPERAAPILAWIQDQATPQGDLPEQIPHHLNDPRQYTKWVEKWGAIATPLLWSHAQYVILVQSLPKRQSEG